MKAPADVLDLIPFARTLGLSVIRDDPSEVRVHLAWKPDLCTTDGLLHGGVIMAVADTAGGICAFRNIPAGAGATVTVESKTNFLNAVSKGSVDAIATPIHVGRTLIVVQSDIRDDQDRLVARVMQSQLVLGQRGSTE